MLNSSRTRRTERVGRTRTRVPGLIELHDLQHGSDPAAVGEMQLADLQPDVASAPQRLRDLEQPLGRGQVQFAP